MAIYELICDQCTTIHTVLCKYEELPYYEEEKCDCGGKLTKIVSQTSAPKWVTDCPSASKGKPCHG